MLSNYYSCLRLLVLLLLLLQPQASIVIYSYEFLLPLLFYLLYHSCRCYYLYILLLLYYTYYLLILFVTCHLSPPKEKRHFCTFLSVMNFSCSFYSLQSSHVLFCNALPTAAAFYPLCDWQLSNGC